MNPLLFAALAAILAVQSNVNITRLEEPVVKETRTLASGTVLRTYWNGWAECEVTKVEGEFVSGRVLRIVYTDQDPLSLTHEALHSVSCIHSGAVGGLLPLPAKTADPEHEWVSYALANPEAAITIMGRK